MGAARGYENRSQSPLHRGLYSDITLNQRREQLQTVSIPSSSGRVFGVGYAFYVNAWFLVFQSPFHRGLYSDTLLHSSHLRRATTRLNPLLIGASILTPGTWGTGTMFLDPTSQSPLHRGLYSDP